MDAMNAMIASRLLGIRDLFRAIRGITSRVLSDFSIEALDAAVRQRAVLLLRIDSEHEALGAFDVRLWKEKEQVREIRSCIDDIRRFDLEAAALVRQRMNDVRRELSSLSDSSCAARQYTRNSRF
jgi:hypothetical protein